MRILFYLPVVTPWWFDNIIIPMIRTLNEVAEIHVLVPPVWRNTGVTRSQLVACKHLDAVQWHIVDDQDHWTLRTVPADPEGLIDFVRHLAPDYVLCRSADRETPIAFPGQIRFLMEAGAPPLPGIDTTFMIQHDLLHSGQMPVLSVAELDRINEEFRPAWDRAQHRVDHLPPFNLTRTEALEALGLPANRKIVALALEYANEENFFEIHHGYPDALDLVAALASRLSDDMVLAVTEHPLNHLYADNSALYEAIEKLGDCVRLVESEFPGSLTTDLLAKHCDGLIVQNSKSIFTAAFFSKPILRLSTRPTAPWLRAYTDIDVYIDAVRNDVAVRPAEEDARTWFGFQLMHEVVYPDSSPAHELLDRLENPFSVDRLQSGLTRFEALERAHVARLSAIADKAA